MPQSNHSGRQKTNFIFCACHIGADLLKHHICQPPYELRIEAPPSEMKAEDRIRSACFGNALIQAARLVRTVSRHPVVSTVTEFDVVKPGRIVGAQFGVVAGRIVCRKITSECWPA
jgi:hypothetical protein